MQMESRMATDPRFHPRMFVCAIIVHDQMEIEAVWRFGVDFLQEPNELLVPVARHAVADHFAVEHAQGRKQCRGAIAFVIVRHGSATALFQWKAWLGAVECLDLAFFVDTEH